jgi:tetratricopeptide (TPR) repeat protein
MQRFLAFGLLFILSCLPAAAADVRANSSRTNYLAQANQMYLAHRYYEACNLFYQAIVKEKAGPSAWLYMAHCQYSLGRTKDAMASYKRIKETFPTLAEGKTAAMYLAREENIHPAAAPIRVHESGTSATSVTTLASASMLSGLNQNPLIGRITMIKPVVGHPEVAAGTADTIKDYIRDLPANIQAILLQGNVKFCITPTLIDRNPERGYREGRGYDGMTYKQCPGMFDGQTIILCERTVNEVSNDVEAPLPPGDVNQTFYHEVGHALDGCLGSYSHSPEYRHAYYLDIARVPPDAAQRLAYYMQKSSAGQEESCAEITCVCLGGASRHADEIKTYFPLTMAVVQKKIGIDGQAKIAGRRPGSM